MRQRNQKIRPYLIIAACLLAFVVALRWLNSDTSDSEGSVFSDANATADSTWDEFEKLGVAVPLSRSYGDQLEQVSQTDSGPEFVSKPELDFDPKPNADVDVGSAELPEATVSLEYSATSAMPIAEAARGKAAPAKINVAEADVESQTSEVVTTSSTQVVTASPAQIVTASPTQIVTTSPTSVVTASATQTLLNETAPVNASNKARLAEQVERMVNDGITAIPATFTLTDFSVDLVDNLESVTESINGFDVSPIGLTLQQPGDRLAALPQKKDKPRFKKFGAKKPKSDDKDDDDEKDEDDDPPTKQPVVLSASNRWKLAGEPKKGDRYKDDTPLTDEYSQFIEGAHGNFSPTPTMQGMPYDPYGEMNVYQGKTLYSNQRPLLELGRPWYQLGPISEGSSILGFHNHVNPQYLLFGDARTGFASNRINGDTNSLVATQLNLIHHFKFTSTERFVAGMTPLSGAKSTNYNFDENEGSFEGDADLDFAYFEGDIGAITGGAIGQTLPFDLPFAAGIVPLVFQNGIWMEDEVLGFAVTIPARNSPRFDISNMDITFFAGYDKLNSPAFQGDDSAARVMGVATFIEALNGYFEVDYAFLDDRTGQDRSYHNMAIGYTRRYGRFISNSTRIIVNAGQQSNVPGTADGVLLLSENSLITGSPSTVVPYFNMFAGFDRPQSVGRNAAAGGILRNTGILFESDNLTGYPTLDATANDTFGMALGLNLLADEFAQQLIVEVAALGVMGDDANRNAVGDQYGVGVRYQLPLTNSVIFRADAMVGFLRGDEDINGGRMEIRKKF